MKRSLLAPAGSVIEPAPLSCGERKEEKHTWAKGRGGGSHHLPSSLSSPSHLHRRTLWLVKEKNASKCLLFSPPVPHSTTHCPCMRKGVPAQLSSAGEKRKSFGSEGRKGVVKKSSSFSSFSSSSRWSTRIDRPGAARVSVEVKNCTCCSCCWSSYLSATGGSWVDATECLINFFIEKKDHWC